MPNMVSLVCEFDGHTWMRESQRGRRPRFCPAHKPVGIEPEGEALTITQDSSEILEMAQRTRLPEYVVAALMRAGLEVPDRDTVDQRGYTFRETTAIGA